MEQPTLDIGTRLGFAFGHVLNDLAASLWFAYALLFYKLTFGAIGYVFVVFAQVVDAITTMALGFLLDSEWIGTDQDRIFRMGRYTAWYCFGTILVVISFPFEIGDEPLIIANRTVVHWVVYIAVLVSQIGWTFCQLSHLSMINRISVNAPDRIYLSSVRQAACIYSSLVIYMVFWFTLANTNTRYLNQADIYIFSNNAYFTTFYGLLHCFVYLYLVRERSLVAAKRRRLQEIEQQQQQHQNDETNSSAEAVEQKKSSTKKIIRPPKIRRAMDDYNRLDWFSDPTYYKVAIIYMLARLFNNLNMAYTPLYLQETLFLEKTSIAFIPLLVYFSGLLMSFCSNHIENRFGNQCHMFVGIILGLVASIWLLTGSCHSDPFKRWQIYMIAIFIGCSMTIVKISSISMVAEMIGQNLTSISFIYGTISCFEKIIGGIVIAVLEQFSDPAEQFANETMAAAAIVERQNRKFSSSSPCPIPGIIDSNVTIWQTPAMFYQYILSHGNILILASLAMMLLLFQKDEKQNDKAERRRKGEDTRLIK